MSNVSMNKEEKDRIIGSIEVIIEMILMKLATMRMVVVSMIIV